jgi:signal transduction histidine kinase
VNLTLGLLYFFILLFVVELIFNRIQKKKLQLLTQTAAELVELKHQLKGYEGKDKIEIENSIESLNFCFVILDHQKNILIANTAAKKLFGDQNFAHIVEFFGTYYDLATAYTTTLLEKTPALAENVNANGKFYKLSLFPVISGENVSGAVLIVEDVTDSVLLERNKEEFFAVASHELRTPLAAIRGNMSIIKDYHKDKVAPEVLELITQSYNSCIGLIKIVNNFLDSAKFESGAAIGTLEPVDAHKLVEEVVENLTALAQEKKLELLYRSKSTLPPVLANVERLRQVVYNLVGNAINYTQAGRVEIMVSQEGQMLKFVVRDSGIGISPQNQKLLFKKFQQAGKTVLSREGNVGTGMGLYVSKLLVQAMHGQIGLIESSSQGSSFYFTIPITNR